ncbi:hypothetical protein M407DRAFT_7015 [Tulasnella calospora MUT 4182]|uniref:Uncharacterized protein n=1 Tax=Tulasnella calospora MUT 4182 TaxID=1051891 RepID=A0A0C3L2R0_9AGAM|nr:hypothetical protein M407DRAFT_7015 [Tulasnella calospora MUT 4182]
MLSAELRGPHFVSALLLLGGADGRYQRLGRDWREVLGNTRRSFRLEPESSLIKAAILSHFDVAVALRDLEGNTREVFVQKNELHSTEFAESADAGAIAEGTAGADKDLLEMNASPQAYVSTLLGSVDDEEANNVLFHTFARRSNLRSYSLRGSTKMALNKFESSIAEVENFLLRQNSIESRMERMADRLADHKKLGGAVDLGNHLAASPRWRKGEGVEKDRVGLEEKGEEQPEVRVPSETMCDSERKAKGEAGKSRHEKGEVRRKLEKFGWEREKVGFDNVHLAREHRGFARAPLQSSEAPIVIPLVMQLQGNACA